MNEKLVGLFSGRGPKHLETSFRGKIESLYSIHLLRVMVIKKSTLGAQFFPRPLNCRVVCGTPFKKNIWVPIFSKNLPGTGSMYHTFCRLRSPTFCHILRVPGGVRHHSFVFIRQRVRAPGRSPCIIFRQRVREPGRSRVDHPTFTSGHRLVPTCKYKTDSTGSW